jgi:hypothetical protein
MVSGFSSVGYISIVTLDGCICLADEWFGPDDRPSTYVTQADGNARPHGGGVEGSSTFPLPCFSCLSYAGFSAIQPLHIMDDRELSLVSAAPETEIVHDGEGNINRLEADTDPTLGTVGATQSVGAAHIRKSSPDCARKTTSHPADSPTTGCSTVVQDANTTATTCVDQLLEDWDHFINWDRSSLDWNWNLSCEFSGMLSRQLNVLT